MSVQVEDVGDFVALQVAEFRGSLGALGYLREAEQGGALGGGHFFVEHDAASFNSHERRGIDLAAEGIRHFRSENGERKQRHGVAQKSGLAWIEDAASENPKRYLVRGQRVQGINIRELPT